MPVVDWRWHTHRFRTALDSSADAVFLIDLASMRFVDMNETACVSVGYTRSELLTMGPHDIKPLLTREQLAGNFGEIVRGGGVGVIETVHRRKDGTDVWVEELLRSMEADGHWLLVAAVRDITQRQQAEQALRLSEEHFRSLIENAADIILVTTAEGRVLYSSPSVRRVVGYAPGALLGANLLELVHLEDLPRARAALDRAAGRPDEAIAETIRIHHANGSWRVLEVVGKPEFGQPGGVRLVLNGRDITYRRELETQFRQVQKLEPSGQLAAGAAHDFKNIFAAIQEHADILLKDGGEHSHAADSLHDIGQACQRAANLTRQLLTFGRRQAMQNGELDLNAVIQNVANMLRRVLGENIALDTALSADPASIDADAGLLEQVLMNLAANARDAMPKGGQFHISTAIVDIAAAYGKRHPEAKAGPHVCLCVRDTGRGIAPEILPRIFEPFLTAKEDGKVTGLGLATVYGIVKQHRGWIEVESQVGQGTTFKVYLDYVKGEQEKTLPRIAAPLPAAAGTILLVEDEPGLRAVTQTVLRSAGYQVLTAGSGSEALKFVTEKSPPFDLLLADMGVPDGMTGRVLAAQLRAQRPDLKVLFSSGCVNEPHDNACRERHGAWFLPKPYDARTLCGMVARCLHEPGQSD